MVQVPSTQVKFDAVVKVGDEAVLNAEWSADSRQFAFSSVEGLANIQGIQSSLGPVLAQPAWKLYDLSTQNLTSHKVWPFQPTLTPAQVEIFRPEGYIYVAPDKNTWFYSQRDSQENLKYVLANRQSGQYFITDLISWGLNPPGNQFVKWSEDSKSAAISYINLQSEVINYLIDFQDNTVEPVIFPFNVDFDGKTYFSFVLNMDRLFDIAADGDAVLVVGREKNNGSNPYIAETRLIFWKPKTPEDSLLLDQIDPSQVATISFTPGSPDQLFLLDADSNLLLYDIPSNKLTVLAANLTYNSAFNAWFSPDGTWLALLVQDELRFLNVSKLLLANIPG